MGQPHCPQGRTLTTIIKKGLPSTAFQFKGSILNPLLKELIKLLTKDHVKSLTVHLLEYLFA